MLTESELEHFDLFGFLVLREFFSREELTTMLAEYEKNLARIQVLYAAGLNSRVIDGILPCIHDADGGPNESTTETLAAELRIERERIDRKIEDLQRSREILDEVIATAALPA